MSFDIIPTAFRAEIIAALREHSSTQPLAPALAAMVADLEAGELSSNNIVIVTGRRSDEDEDSLVFVDHRNADPSAVLLGVDEDTALELTNNDKAYVDSTDLTYYLTDVAGSKLVA